MNLDSFIVNNHPVKTAKCALPYGSYLGGLLRELIFKNTNSLVSCIGAKCDPALFKVLYNDNDFQLLCMERNLAHTNIAGGIVFAIKNRPNDYICLEQGSCGNHKCYDAALFSSDIGNTSIKAIQYLNEHRVIKSADDIEIGIVRMGDYGLEIDSFSMPNPVVDIQLNYGSDFYQNHYPQIKSKLTNIPKGVYIFSGGYGTGKTYFIQHLANEIKRPFIYMSESLLGQGIDSPAIVSLLAKKPNSVLLIEDGENFITSRDGGQSLVSSILNCSDGILGNIINCSIIITHNQKAPNIDKALLRKGRLQYQYVFGNLPREDAQKKIDSLKIDYKVDNEMSLAEIYNLHTDNNVKQEVAKRMGF